MPRVKKEESRDKRYWLRCTDEQYNQVKAWSQGKGVSMGEITIAKLFGIEIIETPEVRECSHKVKTPKGKIKEYTRQYTVKKKAMLKPVKSK